MTLKMAGLVISLTLLSCARPPDFPVSARDLTNKQMLSKADLIVVGRMENIHFLGKDRHLDNGFIVRLWRVRIERVVVLKGEWGQSTLEYFLYGVSPTVVQNGEFEFANLGQNRIFFLRKDGSSVRAVTDLYQSSVPFRRSAVPKLSANIQESMGQKIARLYLTQAENESATAFTTAISSGATLALRFGGYRFTSQLLRQLVENNTGEIRAEACLVSYEKVFAPDTCIRAIEQAQPNTAIRERISKMRDYRKYIRGLAKSALDHHATSPFASGYTYDRDPASSRDFFTFLSQNPDPVFRASAQAALRLNP